MRRLILVLAGSVYMTVSNGSAQNVPLIIQPNADLNVFSSVDNHEAPQNVLKDILSSQQAMPAHDAESVLNSAAPVDEKLRASMELLTKSTNPAMQKLAVEFLRPAAGKGSIEAIKQLGVANQFGLGTAQDQQLAFKNYLAAANLSDTSSQADLGKFFQVGTGTLTNYPQSLEWLSKAYNSGNKAAAADLARAYQYGLGTKKDLDKSEKYWNEIINSDAAQPEDYLGYAGLKWATAGMMSLDGDVLPNIEKAANQGDSFAVGLAYDFSVLSQKKEAINAWQTKLIDLSNNNNSFASLKLGDDYLSGKGGVKDPKIALSYFKRAMDQGDPRGAALVGKLWLDDPTLDSSLSKFDVKRIVEGAVRKGDSLGLLQLSRLKNESGSYLEAYHDAVTATEFSKPEEKSEARKYIYETCRAHLVSSCKPVPVFYFTNRKPDPGNTPAFTGERDESGKLTYGVASITIPTKITTSAAERSYPSILWRTGVNGILGHATPLPSPPDLEKADVSSSTSSATLDEFLATIEDAMKAASRTKVFVFIHGYNNSFDDAARRAAILSEEFKFPGIPILLSWPSAGKLAFNQPSEKFFPELAYKSDERSVAASCKEFRSVLEAITRKFEKDNVIVLAHSMGNRLLNYAMSTCPNDTPDTRSQLSLGKVILAAPDVGKSELMDGLAQYKDRVTSVTLYATANDFALRSAESILNRDPRAGIGGDRRLLSETVDTVDATPVENQAPEQDPINHANVFDVPQVKQDLYELIRWSDDPADRRCTAEERDAAQKKTYWLVLPACLS